MNYSTRDTEWAVSAKGNSWKRQNGIVMVIGLKKQSGKYWAMRDGNFLKGNFDTKRSAMHAAEFGGEGDSTSFDEDVQDWSDFYK